MRLNALNVRQVTIALRERRGRTIVLKVPIVPKGLKLQSLAQKVFTSRLPWRNLSSTVRSVQREPSAMLPALLTSVISFARPDITAKEQH